MPRVIIGRSCQRASHRTLWEVSERAKEVFLMRGIGSPDW
jgi:hypothetical protein